MLVSLRNQSMKVYTGDQLTALSNVSTGKAGHRTPTGIFSILEKRRYHESNIYSQAPMPYMQRLTWSGIALHESNSVPDYPASHGCVRLPGAFASQLFGFTDRGAHVLITEDELTPQPIQHRNLIYPGGAPQNMSVKSLSAAPALQTSIQKADSSSVVRVVEYKAETKPDSSNDALAVVGSDFKLRGGMDVASSPATTAAGEDEFKLPKSRAPIRILITRRTGRHLVQDIQAMLNELGHEAGEADGLIGPETGNAIVRYQKSRELTPTGTVSVALAGLLHADTGRGAFPTGYIYVRQGFKPVFDAPIVLRDPSSPLGTHFLAALSQPNTPDGIRWVHTALADTPRPSPLLDVVPRNRSSFVKPVSVHAALDRIEVPDNLQERLTAMMVPGSSLIVTDNGLNNESHLGTDFIVLTKSSSAD